MNDPVVVALKTDPTRMMAVLRRRENFGVDSFDIVSPVRRLTAMDRESAPAVHTDVDVHDIIPYSTPAELLSALPAEDNWSAQGRRTLGRLFAHYLVCEDPQRRFDSRTVNTLSHQVSLVRHVLENDSLRRVLVADEVGLGKTVEAGLLIKELLDANRQLRVLYLAPARLVRNVRSELERLGLPFREWSSADGDARWTDPLIVGSIHRAVHPAHRQAVRQAGPWDIVVVDECHHLSAWSPEGGDPREQYRLVRDLVENQPRGGRLILMSGTPHQGHADRFENLLHLLRSANERREDVSGRVIYRTKDEIRDWNGNLLFPRREIREPLVVDLGPEYRDWITCIHRFYKPSSDEQPRNQSWRRAAGWRCAQALQWAASSPQAGLGYLVRQAIRAGWTTEDSLLADCLAALRPYRRGPADEGIPNLFDRIRREMRPVDSDLTEVSDLDDIGDDFSGELGTTTDEGLYELLQQGLALVNSSGDQKWERLYDDLLISAGGEKVVLFAQPIETVTALAQFLARKAGVYPAIIIGGQTDAERGQQVERFRSGVGPQFLISSRAGGEGINLQFARRLIHVDVPWNPMDMEQRVGRVHRFGSRRTILVDTVVVKDSREEDAYRVAREKLRRITSTLVEPERFESMFSRVMSLTPPETLQEVLINEPIGPLTDADVAEIGELVQEGFRAWSEFDLRFAKQQEQIRSLDSGLVRWEDVARFAEQFGDATRVTGFSSQLFVLMNGQVDSVESEALAIRFPSGRSFVCGDDYGSPVVGPAAEAAAQIGLNVSPMHELLAKSAFPASITGAGHLRWPVSREIPAQLEGVTQFGAVALLRQTVRQDDWNGWVDAGSELRCFVVRAEHAPLEMLGEEKRLLLTGIFEATLRIKPDSDEKLADQIRTAEHQLVRVLRVPTESERELKLRAAVMPVAALTVAVDRGR